MALFSPDELLTYLHRQGLLSTTEGVSIRALGGGVSSAIHVVESPAGTFAIKQALEKLRVADEWHCDPRRNLFEQDFLALAAEILPGSVPSLMLRDRENGLFVMEYLGGDWSAWKTRLWRGELSERIAVQAGNWLGTLHRTTWGDANLAGRFDNTPLFHELRLAPYLLTTADRHPQMASLFREEVARISRTRLALVHGDYSPKNLLTDGAGLKVIDAEVAWFGDPAFDLAFLSSHLLLKAVRFPERAEDFAALQATFLAAYRQALGPRGTEDLETRAARLCLLLMMARISGKSPVEYFDAAGADARFVLAFAARELASDRPAFSLIATRLPHALHHDHHLR